ncbi:MAG: hypothetical protein ACKO96_02540, partial [Flammeovirgaceae bacterium]
SIEKKSGIQHFQSIQIKLTNIGFQSTSQPTRLPCNTPLRAVDGHSCNITTAYMPYSRRWITFTPMTVSTRAHYSYCQFMRSDPLPNTWTT